MKQIQLSNSTFDSNGYWCNAISDKSLFHSELCVNLFDQNGYHLTPIEQAYADVNGYPIVVRRHETVIRKPWLTLNNVFTGAHINHSDLFERKGYDGDALDQLKLHVSANNLLWKIIKMKPKWGIDISIDYTDESGNVFEVFHYEWDSFEYEPIAQKKQEIENFVLSQDWDYHAKEVLRRRDEWFDLDFFGQSKWRTDFYNLSPEKFKHIIWKK